MTVQNLSAQASFITKDGSAIRSIETRSLPTSLAATHRGFAFYVSFPKSSVLDRTNAPVQNQSLAEARVPAGGRTERHYHKVAEELYFILEGAGEIELDGERRMELTGSATWPVERKGSGRAERERARYNGRPGRCDPHPFGNVAHDHGYRAATLSLLLRAALCTRGYVF